MIPRRTLPSLFVLTAAFACGDDPRPTIPPFDTSGTEPAVAHRLETLREAAEANPDDGATWGRLALGLHAHGFLGAALQAYEAARSLAPGEFAYVYLPATILVPRGEPDAEELMEDALELKEDHAPLLLMLGQWRLDHGEARRVGTVIEGSAALTETPAHAHLLLARAALAEADTTTARGHLDDALEIAPRFAAVHAVLASLARVAGDAEAAELAELRARLYGDPPIADSLRARVAAAGVSSRWHILRGQALLNSGAPEAAAQEFEAAQRLLPNDGFVARHLGLALRSAGRYDEAAAAFRRALELTPGRGEARSDLAVTLFRLGRMEEALSQARNAVEALPTSSEAWLTYAMLEQARGAHRAAASLLARALQNVDFDPRIALRLAWILATTPDAGLREGHQAVALAEAANRIEGFTEPASLDVLAAAYAEYGDLPRALAAAERASVLADEREAKDLAAAIRQHLQSLREGRPIRE